MSKRLTPADIEEAARDYGEGLEPALLWAVADVESSGSGFLSDGLRPKILFEGHILWRRLKYYGINPAPIQVQAPDICFPKWTRAHYKGGAREYDRLAVATSFHPQAALESASWGMFQIMGFNYAGAGFYFVEEFVRAMYQSERQHLRAVVRWMKSNGLLKRLAAKDWQVFTAGYNGPGQVSVYSARLRAAYEKRLAA